MSPGDGKRSKLDVPSPLPEELIIEILSRLLPAPATVGRYRCVSKSWRRILSDPELITKSIKPRPPPTAARVMIARSASETTSYSIHSSSDLRLLSTGAVPSKAFIAGCCGGVFCIGWRNKGKFVLLWNPTNSETYQLPSIPLPAPVGRRGRGRFVEPVGFGFDPVKNDYKVLLSVSTGPQDLEPDYFVYRLRGNSYQQVKGIITPGFSSHRVVQSQSCSPAAKCHWIDGVDQTGYYSFTSFDMSKEEFTQLHLPSPPSEYSGYFPVYNDAFHMTEDGSGLIGISFQTEVPTPRTFFQVWATLSYVALAKGKCSWIRLYDVVEGFPSVVAPPPTVLRLMLPGIWKHGKVFAQCTMDDGDELRVVDLETKNWELQDLEIKLRIYGGLKLFTYLPSTMSLSGFAGGRGRDGERKRCRLIP